jgi:hypothetical protein
MAALSFEELRARALAVIDAVEHESPGLEVLVVLVQPIEDERSARFAAETSLSKPDVTEILRLVSSAWGQA